MRYKTIIGLLSACLMVSLFVNDTYSKENDRLHEQVKRQSEILKSNKQHERELQMKLKNTSKSMQKQIDTLKEQNIKKDEKIQQLHKQVDSIKKIRMEVTAFTSGYESTQKRKGDVAYGITASGTSVNELRTIACPPSFPFGTKLKIENIGIRVCEDRGGRIKDNHLDLYIEDLQQAITFGRKLLWVEIIS